MENLLLVNRADLEAIIKQTIRDPYADLRKKPQEKKIFDLDTAVEFLNDAGLRVTKSSVYGAIRNKLLNSKKISGRITIRRADLLEWANLDQR